MAPVASKTLALLESAHWRHIWSTDLAGFPSDPFSAKVHTALPLVFQKCPDLVVGAAEMEEQRVARLPEDKAQVAAATAFHKRSDTP